MRQKTFNLRFNFWVLLLMPRGPFQGPFGAQNRTQNKKTLGPKTGSLSDHLLDPPQEACGHKILQIVIQSQQFSLGLTRRVLTQCLE